MNTLNLRSCWGRLYRRGILFRSSIKNFAAWN